MPAPEPAAVTLAYPFRGRWLARNSPAKRVPSHGTHFMGQTYAIDFIAVDERGRSGARSWRSMLSSERPEDLVGFGAPILAPCPGRVVITHDGEPDHEARRSPLTLVPYLLTQAERARRGPAGLAGNHVVIAARPGGPFVVLAHLRQGSITVVVGDEVTTGQTVAQCGNSGNSTQPHLHLQAIDSTDWSRARGLPLAFAHATAPQLPRESQIVTV